MWLIHPHCALFECVLKDSIIQHVYVRLCFNKHYNCRHFHMTGKESAVTVLD